MDNRPFDLVIIVAPHEYSDLYDFKNIPGFGGRFEFVMAGLEQLARVCKENAIPVRCSDGNQIDDLHIRSNGEAVTEDELIRSQFDGCDYQGELNIASIVSTAAPLSRIMFTGGYFDNQDGRSLRRVIQQEKLNQDDVEDGSSSTWERRFAFVKGCVTQPARFLYERLTERGKRGIIYFDPRSSVFCVSQPNPRAIYVFERLISVSGDGDPYMLTSKCPRSEIMPIK